MVDGFYFDAETCSAADLKKVGAFVYARHPTTDLRCLSYCLVRNGKRGPTLTWFPGDPVPPTVLEIAADTTIPLIAFNIAFDGQIWEAKLTPRYNWPKIARERYRCAQAAALTRALPASLDAAAAVLGLPTRKSEEGIAAMLELARPRRQSKKERLAGAPPDFTVAPEKLAMLAEYNRCDVMMMIELVDAVGLISPTEQAIWELDQKINTRGVYADLAFIESALTIEDAAQRNVRTEIAELTDGVITSAKQRDRILKWLLEHDCELTDLRHGTVVAALADPKLTKPARQLLELRQGGAGAAALKFKALQRWTDGEDEPRIRYAYRYHGASSGRFTSVGVQLHNLRKPEIEDTASAIAAVATGSFDEMRRRGFPRPLETIGHVTRASVRAAPGTRLFIADLSSIEARGGALVVKRTAELQQWREFDRSGRPETEPYYITGIKTFNQPPEKARKVGKVGRLAFQYQGGVGAYRRITGDQESSDELVEQRRDRWRADHPEFVQFWRTSIFQAVQAIQHPGEDFTLGLINFHFDPATKFLELTLPSGRKLTYPKAELITDERYDSVSFTFLDASGSRVGRMYHERRGSGAFGGLLLENITQAICRDIFVEAMPQLEAAGYPIVMHTHDEVVCEVAEGFGSLEEFLTLVTKPPTWAPALPIAAKARISDRLIEITTATPVEENTIDNSVIVDDEDDENEEDTDDPPPSPAPPQEKETAHICAQCQLPADGIGHTVGDVWLHPDCEEIFIRARMQEQGIPWIEPPPPPPPPSGNGRGNGQSSDGFEDFSSARTRGSSSSPQNEAAASPSDPATDEYIYKNAAGRLHMRVMRTSSKNFPTFYWGDGAWIAGWPKEVVPYRLPEFLAAAADVVVLICEGEKDANTAARHGFIATCNPGGAGKWQLELTQYFKGKQHVVLMQDHDDNGRAHTALVAERLKDIVPTIGVVSFPELPEHGDLTDFFERGGTKQALQIRIDDALKRGMAAPYVLVNLHNVVLKAQAWLWRGHYPIGALELTTGVVGLGKGLLQCDIIARTTTGANWPDGSPGPIPGRVIILTAEDRKEDYRRRCQAAGADLRKIEIFDCVRRNERDELFLLGQDLDKLELACRQLGDVSLVNIDPITAFMGSGRGFDSHRATDVRSQLHPLAKLAERLNIAFGAVTHPPKGAASRAALDSFIGSQAFIAAARVGHYCVAELGPEDDRGFRRPTGRILFATVKYSHSAPPPTLAFRREVVGIGYDAQAGESIDAPRIVWDPQPLDLTAEEAIAANREARGDGRKMRAAPIREFLRDMIANGPVLLKIIKERGAVHGFKLGQLKRARQDIGAKAFKRKGENLDSPWMWAMPEHVPDGSIEESSDNEEDPA
jgi:AAA domain-containing protein